ncbi:MAG TPA: regulatory iron-sulfur-containing complex subunit RicT [Candidatus Saccharimonadales bacterium]|nr:regulatory iron-sulfur-containing complex subunit RicT [Candidatus Saccharimonadales bacterium]
MVTAPSCDLVEVTFRGFRREIVANTREIDLTRLDSVIVEVDRGEDIAKVSMLGEIVNLKADRQHLVAYREILRKVTPDDAQQHVDNRQKENEAFHFCRERIGSRQLEMDLSDVEMQFDGHRMTYYFTAEKRVDFRELVKDLAARYHTRIELRQIGVRDEAKRMDGYGVCGRRLCCTSWLKGFSPVTLRMAKDQDLALSPSKISGVCGRLMCCLAYEVDFYREATRLYPKPGEVVQTQSYGRVEVRRADFFRLVIHGVDSQGQERAFRPDEIPGLVEKLMPAGRGNTDGNGNGCNCGGATGPGGGCSGCRG